ncbi:uncharacterized protein [Rutidosis leptorrhynchoides]|uniref:uncharacterized protein n=1 Tax=Rutidosis leptorrhynchoides TaxID=125765 RepID=UPI003A9A03D9
MVMFKVSMWMGKIQFRKRGKLAHRFIGPLKILTRGGEVAYRLELPKELAGIHNTFHVSHLHKCLADNSTWAPLDEISLNKKLEYIEEPMEILDEKGKILRNKEVRTYKVKWRHRKGSKFTWEPGEFVLVYLPACHAA